MARPRPLVLVILDGWGHAPASKANAISLARKPNFDRLLAEYPNTLVHTSGRHVGLPEGQMGNSEVGHLNIGAGRVVYMDSTRIDLMLENGEFFKNPVLLAAMRHAASNGRRLHLFGLLSDGGVHSHQNHLYALLRMARENGLEKDRVAIHCFMDGRDTLPTSGAGYIAQLQQQVRSTGAGAIASVSGRYYAMDRDRRWERIALAYNAMVHADGDARSYTDPERGVRESYDRGATDEFIPPFVIHTRGGEPVATIRDSDACISFNFRADRARQITRALARNSGLTKDDGRDLPGADDLDHAIPRADVPRALHYVCMTRYDKLFTLPYVVPVESLNNILAHVLGEHGLRNLRVAETEKYAHVTYFFNGGVEKEFPGEERRLIPSPKVATYDLKPEMSAPGVAQAVVEAVEQGSFDVIIVNFANADMVGHSGQIPPTVQAVETVDACLGDIYSALRARGGAMLITADHGNAEQMLDPKTGGPHTAHTTNPVPFIAVAPNGKRFSLRNDGALQDIAPTVLALLGLPQPNEMSGKPLLIPIPTN